MKSLPIMILCFIKKEVYYEKIFGFRGHLVLDTWISFDVSILALLFLA